MGIMSVLYEEGTFSIEISIAKTSDNYHWFGTFRYC